MNLRKIVLTLGVVAGLSWAAPAYATSYGSASSPIKITSNGNGWFYGNITVYNHQSLRNGYFYRDTDADGNAVYVQTDWSFYEDCDDGSVCWRDVSSDQSPRIGTADGKVFSTDYQTLEPEADKGRGATKVCEDQSWSPDPCSGKVTITLSY